MSGMHARVELGLDEAEDNRHSWTRTCQLGAATTEVVHYKWAYCVGREGKMCDTKELGPIIKMRSLTRRLTALLPRQPNCHTEW